MQNGDPGLLKNSPEALAYQFIQNCLRLNTDINRARALSSHPNFSWQAFLSVASFERLSPQIIFALRGENFLPGHVQDLLEEVYRYTARRNLLLFHELGAVLKSLAGLGVEAVILKGAALAETVYDTIALRPMGDLDLLLHPEQVEQTIRHLCAAGYTLDRSTNLAGSLEFENQVQLSKPGIEEIGLDLHWTLFDWHYYIKTIPLDWFWQTTQTIALNGQDARILGPEAQLLHLCAHAVIGQELGRGTLLWLVDIKEVICHYENKMAWDVVLEMAEKSGLILPLQRLLPWVAAKLDAPVPGPVRQRCSKMEASFEERKAFELRSFRSPTMAQRVLSDLDNIQSWPARWRYLFTFVGKKLAAPPQNLIERYQIRHPFLLPFYYPFWIVSGFGTFVKLAWQNRNVTPTKHYYHYD